MEPQHLDPRIRTVWLLSGLGLIAAAGTVAFILIAALVAAGNAPRTTFVAPVAFIFVAGALAWWSADVHYRHWTYRLGDDALELDNGVVFRTRSVIPYFRVQHVDTSQGPVERRLGLTSLTVHTASAATDAGIPGLALAESERIRRFVLERAGAGDAV